jgi:hypothetical protein
MVRYAIPNIAISKSHLTISIHRSNLSFHNHLQDRAGNYLRRTEVFILVQSDKRRGQLVPTAKEASWEEHSKRRCSEAQEQCVKKSRCTFVQSTHFIIAFQRRKLLCAIGASGSSILLWTL